MFVIPHKKILRPFLFNFIALMSFWEKRFSSIGLLKEEMVVKNLVFFLSAASAACLAAVIALSLTAPQAWASKNEPLLGSTADHGKFESLNKKFAAGPEVTKACLECHTEASKQLHRTTHWTWEYENPKTGQLLGKKHVVNNFCIATASNRPAAKVHIL